MTDWTSISVTEEQKELLQAEKPENTAMGKFIVGLLEGDTNDTEPMQVVPVEEVVGREVPQSSVEQDRDFDDWFSPDHAKTVAEHIRLELEQTNTVQLEATEYSKIADELEGRLR